MNTRLVFVALALSATVVVATVRPSKVLRDVAKGETLSVNKKLTLDSVGFSRVKVDVCVVQDATGSFSSRCDDIRDDIPAIVDLFNSADVRFGFKSFKDYSDGDEVYQSRLTSGTGFQLENAYNDFCVEGPSGGGDSKEAQYDAIVKATGPGPQGCAFREGSTRIMIAIHDAGCKGPAFGPEYINTRDSVKAALAKEDVVFIGVTTGGLSTNCFQPFADSTGGVIEEVGEFDDLANVVEDALSQATFSVTPSFSSQCNMLDISYEPPFPWALKEGETITVKETITVLADPPVFINCNVEFPFAGLQRVRLDVMEAACGNGVVEDGEQCDEVGPSCDADCTCSNKFRFNPRLNKCESRCGNSRYERRAGEECDGSPFCRPDCQCKTNFTPRRGQCVCLGGTVVRGRCVL